MPMRTSVWDRAGAGPKKATARRSQGMTRPRALLLVFESKVDSQVVVGESRRQGRERRRGEKRAHRRLIEKRVARRGLDLCDRNLTVLVDAEVDRGADPAPRRVEPGWRHPMRADLVPDRREIECKSKV